MAILTQKKIESSHWYSPDGLPAHFQEKARGGGQRPTNLSDARKLGLYPSVTSILGVLAKPQLDVWKQKEVAKAALRTPKKAEESDAYWIDRVIEEAFKQVDDAAETGTKVHAKLESWFMQTEAEPFVPDKELAVYVDPVLSWIKNTGIVVQDAETVLVNKGHGYAGLVDAPFTFLQANGTRGIGVLDFKTRKTRPGEVVTQYDGQLMQVAAYAAAYWGVDRLGECWGTNLYISTTEPGRVSLVRYSPAEMVDAFQAFVHLCEIWRGLKDYDPRHPQRPRAATVGTPQEVSQPDPGMVRPPKDPSVLGAATISFGKHKGLKLDDVPAEYLDWLRGQPDILRNNPDVADYLAHPKIKAAIDQDLDRRNK